MQTDPGAWILIAEIPNALFLFRIECHVVFVLKYTVFLFLPIVFSYSLSAVSSLSVSPSLGKPDLSLLPSFSHSLFHSMHAHTYSLSLTHPQTHKHEFIIVLLSTRCERRKAIAQNPQLCSFPSRRYKLWPGPVIANFSTVARWPNFRPHSGKPAWKKRPKAYKNFSLQSSVPDSRFARIRYFWASQSRIRVNLEFVTDLDTDPSCSLTYYELIKLSLTHIFALWSRTGFIWLEVSICSWKYTGWEKDCEKYTAKNYFNIVFHDY